MPADFNAVISFCCAIRPKVMTLDINNDIGTDSAIIHARFKYKYSKIVSASKPLPKKRSTALMRNCKKSTVVITATDNKNGIKDCLNKYLLSVFI